MKLILNIFLLLLCSVVYGQYKTEIHVATDGTGDFTTIQDAIDGTKSFPDERITIYIKKGVYEEKIKVHNWNSRLTLKGEIAGGVVICWDDYFDKMKRGPNSTFHTATLLVQGDDFRAENLIIENKAGNVGQAVALAVEADRCVIENCRILGNQDTLYADGANTRQHYQNCYIEGTTDFIFGGATTLFENCTIHSKSNSYITAASTPEGRLYGFVFLKCKLTAADGLKAVYLGRPWRSYAKTVFVKCDMGSHIRPEGWHNWNSTEKERTVFYAEGGNTGPGADTTNRVSWAKILPDNIVNKYCAEEVLKPFLLPEMMTPITANSPSSVMPQERKTIITQIGAMGDGKALNTKAIQSAIGQLAADGGGTFVVPEGVFISGSLFLKHRVNLHERHERPIRLQ
ncbi:MAG: hypothetical protein JW860_15640 [Sedimentisphaerales bacterium]|nr:hypothetical protein [Sedimentisphaerales bacterium]